MYLLEVEAIKLDQYARVSAIKFKRVQNENQGNGEIDDCYKKAKILGRLFAKSGSPSTIYAVWGVRP